MGRQLQNERNPLNSTTIPFTPTLQSDDAFLIATDHDALVNGGRFYWFVGPGERVDLDAASSFVTVPRNELERMVGHAIPLNPENGHPILSDAERKMVDAGLAVRIGVIDNKHMSRDAKMALLRELRGMPQSYKISGYEFIEGATPGVRFSTEEAGAPRSVDFSEESIGILLGRSIAASKGKISDDESSFLGTAIAAYEILMKDPKRAKSSAAIAYVKGKHGDAAAKRLRRFLLSVTKAQVDYHAGVLVDLDKQAEAARELQAWAAGAGPFVLERAEGSRFHHLREALNARSVMALTTAKEQPESLRHAFDDLSSSFVVEHDWASAFAGAGDFDTGEFSLPYSKSFWEFQVSGRRVGLAVSDDPNLAVLFLITKVGWVVGGAFSFNMMGALSCRMHCDLGELDPEFVNNLAPGFQALTERLLANVRAVSISLEAEVAETEIVRADYKLNQARERRGKLPLYDYHVVSLVRRSRVAPLPRGEADPDREIARRRCHFRRGHWRHYENHKTWIKWMLVGDPDLGFVDKHYRL